MIDLHMHTHYSDGTNTTEELLKLAEKEKMDYISITDHDCVKSYFDLEDKNIRQVFSGKIISGAEFTTTYKGGVVEVLGYGIDYKYMNEVLKRDDFKKTPLKEKIPIFLKKYHELGIIFNEEEVLKNMGGNNFNKAFYNEFIKYPENDRFLLDIENKENFTRFLRNETNSYKSKLFLESSDFYPDMKKVIKEIHNAGGLAFLAHTYIYAPYVASELEEIIITYDLDGLECYYTKFTDMQTHEINNFCDKNCLLKSGGTDFHGENSSKKGYIIGKGLGNLRMENSIIEGWINEIKLM
ncbi:MAG: PHP domain-containing protein [Clostridiales bacterium]|nr:PHP domain-containing protein [Clostridiales bacterium]